MMLVIHAQVSVARATLDTLVISATPTSTIAVGWIADKAAVST